MPPDSCYLEFNAVSLKGLRQIGSYTISMLLNACLQVSFHRPTKVVLGFVQLAVVVK
jgi:predicted exporter